MNGCRWSSGCWLGTSGLNEEEIGVSRQAAVQGIHETQLRVIKTALVRGVPGVRVHRDGRRTEGGPWPGQGQSGGVVSMECRV